MKKEKYSILVSEPWDFESPDGQNIVRGNILSVKSNQCLVFKANHYLKFDSIESNILILSPRHYGIDFSNLNDNESLSEKELQENTRFVIIGSIRKE